MKPSDYARIVGITKQAAIKRFHAGSIPGIVKPNGTIEITLSVEEVRASISEMPSSIAEAVVQPDADVQSRAELGILGALRQAPDSAAARKVIASVVEGAVQEPLPLGDEEERILEKVGAAIQQGDRSEIRNLREQLPTEQARAQLIKACGLQLRKLLGQYEMMSDLSMSDYVESRGGEIFVKDSAVNCKIKSKAIKKISSRTVFSQTGERAVNVSIEFYDKLKAMDALANIVGLSSGFDSILRGLEKYGIALRFNSQSGEWECHKIEN